MPTDPRNDRKHPQAKPAQKTQMQQSGTAQGKKSGAASTHAHASSHHGEYRAEKSAKHAESRKSGYAADGNLRKSHDADVHRAAEYARKKPVRDAYETRYPPAKKKKKFKFKRFFKKLGKEIQAFGAKLIQVEDLPPEEAAYAATATKNGLGVAQKKTSFDPANESIQFGFTNSRPYADASAENKQFGSANSKPYADASAENRQFGSAKNAAGTGAAYEKAQAGFSKSKPVTAATIFRKVKKWLRSAVRFVARGIYFGVRKIYVFLMKLPQRTLLIGSSAFGVLLITVIVLAFALPGKASKAEEGEQLAAFTALETEQTALENATLDGTETGETALDGTLPTDENVAKDEQTDAQVETTETAPTFTGEIQSGDNGALVTTIQSRLMELGYMDSDEPTQHFGPLTQSALKTFQRHNGLGDDGICGQETYNLLMSGEVKVYVMQLGDSGPDVEGIQERLYELGYLDNKANIQGNFGEKTESAAKEFQKKNDLNADGKVGNKTLEMLYGEDVVGNAFTLGDENQVIKDCQTALKKLGYITFKPDGVMGKATVSAIKAFQQANGLTRDGALGPATRDLLLSGEAQEMVMQLGDYGTDVKTMQTRLAKLNYLSSANATGYFGEITEDAVKAFQKRAGLTSDGKVGGVTLTMMNSSSAKKAASKPSTGTESSSGSSSSSSSSSGSSSSGSSGSSSSSASNQSGVEKLVSLAESKVGSKYVRGAKGPNSFDCSGFVYWCLKNSGVSTSYMTSIAWRSNSRFQRSTSMSSIERGDILVFSGESDSTGHVGIYLGGGKMIDASSSEGQVRQSSSVLSSGGYWTRHFICAYRVF